MAAELIQTNYGVRYPKITNITNLGVARYGVPSNNQPPGFKVDVERISSTGNYESFVVQNGTYFLCLVGNRGEQLEYVSPKDSRWRVLSTEKATGASFSLFASPSLIKTKCGLTDAQYEEILCTKRAIHFAVFEKLQCSYSGLTDLYFRIEDNQVTAYSLKNQVLSDKFYNEGDDVWSYPFDNKKPNRVVVDLAERVNGTTGIKGTRYCYVSVGGSIVGFDYYTGKKIGEINFGTTINAMAVNPANGYLWVVVPQGSGKVSVCAIQNTGAKLKQVESVSVKSTKTNAGTLAIPFDKSADYVAGRITGGVISRGYAGALWFSFIVDLDSTISFCVSSGSDHYKKSVFVDRMHYGSWHGMNASPSPTTYSQGGGAKKKTGYGIDKEYGISKGTPNIQGICNGTGSAVFVNGHTYYHEDYRVWSQFSKHAFTTNGARCGEGKYFGGNYWYPSYVVTADGFVLDDSPEGIKNGWYKIEPRKTGDLGYPVDDFWIKFQKDKSGDVAKSYKPSHSVTDSTHCDFGYACGDKKYGYSYDLALAKSFVGKSIDEVRAQSATKTAGSYGTTGTNAQWDGCPSITYENLRPKNEPAHMIAEDVDFNYIKGKHWYQLQDLGFAYNANGSLMVNAIETSNEVKYAASTSVDPQFYISNGVCEDNPSQLTNVTVGTKLNSKTLFDFTSPSTLRKACTINADGSNLTGNPFDFNKSAGRASVHGFVYQKNIRSGTDSANDYFDSICPMYKSDHSEEKQRKSVSVYGWRGVCSAPSPNVWGFSEDWGISKMGHSMMSLNYSVTDGAPPVPKMTMFGMEETLNANGALAATRDISGHGNIILTNSLSPNLAYALAYNSNAGLSSHRLKRSLDKSSSISVSTTSVYDVGIDDSNRLIFEFNGSNKTQVKYTGKASGLTYKYNNPYASDLKQFTVFGNHNNTHQIIEAALVNKWTSKAGMTYLQARAAVRGREDAIANTISSKDLIDSLSRFGSKAWGTQFNNDPTGMDGVKALGYCFSLRTQAHPLPVAPRGRLVITESRVRQERNCYETELGKDFWQKSVIQPTTYNEISGTLSSTDDFMQIESDLIQRNALYSHMGSVSEKGTAKAEGFGLSAAGYDHFATKHLLDVYTSGSYFPDEFILEYRDAEERNRDANKHSTFKSFHSGIDIRTAPSGFYVNYEAPDAWDAITVYGKPIKTETTNGDTAKLYRWGQNTPYEKYTATDILRYSSVHPEVYVNTEAEVRGMTTQSWAWVENNDKDHTKSGQNPRYGYSDANNVSFSAVSYDYPYGNPEIPGSDSITFYFGKNFVHVYERWSTPAMCATSDDPSGGLSLWGECEQ